MRKKLNRFWLAVVAFCGMVCGMGTALAVDLVTYTEATGAVAFTPGNMVTPIITGVIAAVTAAVGLFIVSLGVRWLYKMVRGAK